jgi:hypothetical protein
VHLFDRVRLYAATVYSWMRPPSRARSSLCTPQDRWARRAGRRRAMVRNMWRVFGGAILVIAGIAAFIEAHSHHPVVVVSAGPGEEFLSTVHRRRPSCRAPLMTCSASAAGRR